MERITSARELSVFLVERFRRDGVFNGTRWVDRGELILPIGPALERFCAPAIAGLRQNCDKTATLSRHDCDSVAGLTAVLNRNCDDWRELTDIALGAERKADRARERALRRSHRNTKNPKKKGRCR